jgi:hypothetical protein
MPDLSEQPWALLKQPDQRSCGATVLVVARMLADPAYAASMDGSQGPVGLAFPRTVAGDKALQARFRTETLAMHQRVTGLADVSGKPQIPWPRKFGTPPWAVARQLSGTRAADGSFARYDWHVARTDLPGAYDRLLAAPRAGRVAALFVGSEWIPRHVTLVVQATATGKLEIFDPAYGRLDELDRFAFLGRRIGIAGWDVPWFVITPDT